MSSLPAWPRLTLGKPAALSELDGTAELEHALAEWIGCEAVVLGTSTLHLYCDLIPLLAPPGGRVFVDEGSYPIARWGVERAATAGARWTNFAHYNADTLGARLVRQSRARQVVVVTDGFCPACGRFAPLADFAKCVSRVGGLVIVDDTQALGIFGRSPGSYPPYGEGGGGSVRRLPKRLDNIVVVSSLAKGLGVPVALLGGSDRIVAAFRQSSATRIHCSPPSAAVLAAAHYALKVNARRGDGLRRRLAGRVARFRAGLASMDLVAVPGYFPVQPLLLPKSRAAGAVHRGLLRGGVRAVLQTGSPEGSSRISFVLTARHQLSEIDRALEILADVLTPALG